MPVNTAPLPSRFAHWNRMQSIGLLLLMALLALNWSSLLDDRAADYLNQSLQRTLATFALARALNGAISMLQDADISLTPVGLGLNFSPGELLDPVNDLIEQFSSLLLMAATALGVQRFALELGGTLVIKLALTLALLAYLSTWWWSTPGWRRLALRALLFCSLLRLFVPAYALLAQVIDQALLAPRFEAARAALDLTRAEAEQVSAVSLGGASQPAVEKTWGEKLQGLWQDARQGFDFNSRVRALGEKLARASEQIVELMVIFLLQAVLLPLAFMWLLSAAMRAVLRGLVPASPSGNP